MHHLSSQLCRSMIPGLWSSSHGPENEESGQRARCQQCSRIQERRQSVCLATENAQIEAECCGHTTRRFQQRQHRRPGFSQQISITGHVSQRPEAGSERRQQHQGQTVATFRDGLPSVRQIVQWHFSRKTIHHSAFEYLTSDDHWFNSGL